MPIAQARVLDLIGKWMKLEGVTIGDSLRKKIILFYHEQNVANQTFSESVLNFPENFLIAMQTYNQDSLYHNSKAHTSFGSSSILFYRITGEVSVPEVVLLHKPMDVAEQITLIARGLYMSIEQMYAHPHKHTPRTFDTTRD